MDTVSRREFLATSTMLLSARSYSRIVGANDRIQIGQIGCGHRSAGHRADAQAVRRHRSELRPAQRLRSVVRESGTRGRRRAAAVRTAAEDLSILRGDAGRSGAGCRHDRHRRPPAREDPGRGGARRQGLLLREADGEYRWTTRSWRARRCVASKQVVQMGSQWLSCPYQQRVREIIRSGKLGKIVSISQSWNYNGPRWHVPKDDNVAAIREHDTDWNRWLLGRAERPFDPRIYFEFRIFKDFSGGITDQWYSHGSGLAHFYLDTFIPDDTVSNGGIFAWHDVRENPDTFQSSRRSRRAKCSIRTARPSATPTAITRSFAARGGRSIHRAARAARSGGSSPEPRSGWGSNVVFDLQLGCGKTGTGAACREHRRPAGQSGRQSESAHRQLVRVHAQPEDAERQHRDRLCPRGRGGHGDAQLSRRQEDVLGPQDARRFWIALPRPPSLLDRRAPPTPRL